MSFFILCLWLVLVLVLALVLTLLQKAKVAGSPRFAGDLMPSVRLVVFFFRAHAAEGTLDLTA